MSIHLRGTASGLRAWLVRAFTEFDELRSDLATLWHEYVHRLRTDAAYRNALLQAFLRGLVNVLGRGPRAALLWAITLLCEVVLELLNELQHGAEGEAFA